MDINFCIRCTVFFGNIYLLFTVYKVIKLSHILEKNVYQYIIKCQYVAKLFYFKSIDQIFIARSNEI